MKTAHSGDEAHWRRWVLLLAVALGILVGAMAAGRIKVPIPW